MNISFLFSSHRSSDDGILLCLFREIYVVFFFEYFVGNQLASTKLRIRKSVWSLGNISGIVWRWKAQVKSFKVSPTRRVFNSIERRIDAKPTARSVMSFKWYTFIILHQDLWASTSTYGLQAALFRKEQEQPIHSFIHL